jgi:hypothetical protein
MNGNKERENKRSKERIGEVEKKKEHERKEAK